MAWRWTLDDRWLWLGFGAFVFVAAKGIAYGLRDTLRLTEYDEPTKHANVNNESDAEDSISLASLKTLAASSNPDISHAAISLLVSRFALSDTACTDLTMSLFSENPIVRNRSKQLLDLLDDYPLPQDFAKPDILRAEPVRHYQSAHQGDDKIYMMCTRFFKALSRLQHGMATFKDVAESVETAMLGWNVPYAMMARAPHNSVSSTRYPLAPELPREGSRESADDDGHGSGASLFYSDDFRDPGVSHVVSLDRILGPTGPTPGPRSVPGAALSALLRTHPNRADMATRTTRFPEESPEEAEVRRRRNRAARVMEIAEDYIII